MNIRSFPHLQFSASAAELGLAIAVLLGSFYLLDLTFGFTYATKAGYAGAALFPQIAIGLLILCAGKLMVEQLLQRRRLHPEGAPAEQVDLDIAGLIPIGVASILYALLLERIGFELCTFGLMLALLGGRVQFVHALWLSIAAMLVIYAIFALLIEVDLPLKFLPAYLPF